MFVFIGQKLRRVKSELKSRNALLEKFSNNIIHENQKLFKIFFRIFITIFFFLFIISFYNGDSRWSYRLLFVCGLSICIVYFLFRKSIYVHIGIYLLWSVLVVYCGYLTIFITPLWPSMIFIGILLLSPLSVIAEIKSMIMCSFFIFITSVIFDILTKSTEILRFDILVNGCFMLIGLCFGYYFQQILLQRIKLQSQMTAKKNMDG